MVRDRRCAARARLSGWGLNTWPPLTHPGSPWNEALRRAVTMAVDRNAIVEEADGHGAVMLALVEPGRYGVDPAMKPGARDVADVAKVVEEAGRRAREILVLASPDRKNVVHLTRRADHLGDGGIAALRLAERSAAASGASNRSSTARHVAARFLSRRAGSRGAGPDERWPRRGRVRTRASRRLTTLDAVHGSTLLSRSVGHLYTARHRPAVSGKTSHP